VSRLRSLYPQSGTAASTERGQFNIHEKPNSNVSRKRDSARYKRCFS